MSFPAWSVSQPATHFLLSSLPSRFMNIPALASFFQRDIAAETSGGFFGCGGCCSTFDSVDSVFATIAFLAATAAAASGIAGSPGAVVTVGGGVNGAPELAAALTRPNCQQCLLPTQ